MTLGFRFLGLHLSIMKSVALFRFVCLLAAVGSAAASSWLNANQPIHERVDAIMAEMTLTERIRQLYAVHNYDVWAQQRPVAIYMPL